MEMTTASLAVLPLAALLATVKAKPVDDVITVSQNVALVDIIAGHPACVFAVITPEGWRNVVGLVANNPLTHTIDHDKHCAGLFGHVNGVGVWSASSMIDGEDKQILINLPHLCCLNADLSWTMYHVGNYVPPETTGRVNVQPSHVGIEQAYQTLKQALANRSDRIQATQAEASLDQVMDCLNSHDISL